MLIYKENTGFGARSRPPARSQPAFPSLSRARIYRWRSSRKHHAIRHFRHFLNDFEHDLIALIGVPRVGFSVREAEGLEWLNLTSRLALDGILFLPHQLRSSNTNIMMGLILHHGLEKRGSIYLLVNSLGGNLQTALGLHDCILALGPQSRALSTVLYGLVASSAVLIGACGDFRGGLEHSRFMLHQAEGQQFGVTSEVLLAAREVIRLQSTAAQLVVQLLGLPRELATMEYEQYLSASLAQITGLLTSTGPPTCTSILRKRHAIRHFRLIPAQLEGRAKG